MSLLTVIEKIYAKGLSPADYNFERLQANAADTALDRSGKREMDILLTDGFLALHRHLQHGRLADGNTAWRNLSSAIDTIAVDDLLKSVKTRTVMKSLEACEPQFTAYVALRDTLTKLLSGVQDSVALHHIRSLRINLERLRSYNTKPSRYLHVNIPSYWMSVYESDTVALESRVIIGKATSRTPELGSIIKSFIIYPYWHVPRKIATEEILPSIQKDSAYLQRNNFEVLNASNEVVSPDAIDWPSLNKDYFPYQLRQREGRENSLGIIKFVFNNDYGVYLHDTNSRRLFKKDKRAMSHGCVRVERAVDLARYLVKDDTVYTTPEDLDQYLHLKQRLQLKVVNPLPLFIEYLTCEYKNGRILYYDDIYGKDEELEKVLARETDVNL